MKRYALIPNFDGAKFAARYNLDAIKGEFFVDGNGMLCVPDSLPDNPIQEPCDPPGPTLVQQIQALGPQDCPPGLKVVLLKLAKGK